MPVVKDSDWESELEALLQICNSTLTWARVINAQGRLGPAQISLLRSLKSYIRETVAEASSKKLTVVQLHARKMKISRVANALLVDIYRKAK